METAGKLTVLRLSTQRSNFLSVQGEPLNEHIKLTIIIIIAHHSYYNFRLSTFTNIYIYLNNNIFIPFDSQVIYK